MNRMVRYILFRGTILYVPHFLLRQKLLLSIWIQNLNVNYFGVLRVSVWIRRSFQHLGVPISVWIRQSFQFLGALFSVWKRQSFQQKYRYCFHIQVLVSWFWSNEHCSILVVWQKQTFKLQVRSMLADDCGKERNAALSSASMLLPSTNHPTMLICSLIQVYIVIHQSIKPPLYSDPDINNTYTILAGKKNALQKCTSYYVILKVFRYFPVWIRQSFQLLHVGCIYFIQVT